MTDHTTGPTGPPPGPGVQPPFVAAPVEGRQARIWLGLGIAGGLLAACCGVGVVATGGLALLSGQALNEQAQRAADDYLSALAQQQWQQAYEQKCAADREAESLAEFTDRMSDRRQIEEHQLGELRDDPGQDPFDPSDDTLAVPAKVRYADGTTSEVEVPLEQSLETGEIEVCGRLPGG